MLVGSLTTILLDFCLNYVPGILFQLWNNSIATDVRKFASRTQIKNGVYLLRIIENTIMHCKRFQTFNALSSFYTILLQIFIFSQYGILLTCYLKPKMQAVQSEKLYFQIFRLSNCNNWGSTRPNINSTNQHWNHVVYAKSIFNLLR